MPMSGQNCLTCPVRGSECFCSLTTEALLGLQTLGTRLRFAPGERILQEGDAADRVYVLCKGRVKLLASSPEGKLFLVRVAGPGDVLGLAAALKESTHKVSAEVLESCEMKAIHRTEFFSFMDRFRDVSRNTALSVSLEYEEAMLSVRRLALSNSATQKLASALLEWGRTDNYEDGEAVGFRMPLTHEELGNLAGLSRETVTRLLSKFRREGLIEQEGEWMILRDPEKMKAL